MAGTVKVNFCPGVGHVAEVVVNEVEPLMPFMKFPAISLIPMVPDVDGVPRLLP